MGRGASPWSQQPETLEGDGPSKSPKKQKALVAKKIKTIITQKSRKKEKTRVKKSPFFLADVDAGAAREGNFIYIDFCGKIPTEVLPLQMPALMMLLLIL